MRALKKNNGQRRALIYTRVSTERQQKEATAESQQREARAFAEKRGLAIVRVAHEQHTGAELWERPILTAERERIRNGEYDAVIFHSVDRLSRDAAHLLIFHDECTRAGVEILFVTEEFDATPEGKLMLSVKGFVAEIERLKIRERMTRGKRQRVERGKLINASTPLYGYHQDKETSARTINPSEAKIIRRIWELAAAGIGMHSIARKLNAEGVASPGDGKRVYKDGRSPRWGKSSIQRILREPAYAGLSVAYRWKHEKTNGKERVIENPRDKWIILADDLTPAIITLEEFDRLQEVISNRMAGDAKRNETRPALLRGLIFCGRCGRRRLPESDGYRCGSRASGGGRCGSPATPRKLVEDWAWNRVAALLSDPAALAEAFESHPAEATDKEQLQARAVEIESQLGKLTGQTRRLVDELAEAEDETAGIVRGKLRAMESQKRSLKIEADGLKRKLSAGIEQRENLLEVAEQLRLLAPETVQLDRKILILQAFQVRVVADGRESWGLTLGSGIPA